MSIETFSARDKCWFHPIVGLRYETTPAQLRDVTSAVRQLLTEHRSVDPDSVRVRFLRFGPSSLDIDVFAYVLATDWNQFLEIQEELLMAIMDIVQHTGTEIAFPSQTMYLAKRTSARMARAPHEARPRIKELQEESNLQFEESRNS
jgi:MscS family membrane protein